jgi:hypothetical protein
MRPPCTVTRFAGPKNATPARIALAWLLAKKPFIVSIPGTRNIDHLRENLGALEVRLTPAELSAFDADFSKLLDRCGGGREPVARSHVASYLDQADDAVMLAVQLGTLPDAASYTAQTTLDAKAKNIRVVIQNAGHLPLAR